MDGITVITAGAPPELFEAFGSFDYAQDVLVGVVDKKLGVGDVLNRPAEYGILPPTTQIGVLQIQGVRIKLIGLTCDGRSVKRYHEAMNELVQIAINTTQKALAKAKSQDTVQVWVSIPLDRAIETTPGSGEYSSTLESKAVMVNRDGVVSSPFLPATTTPALAGASPRS